MSWDGWEFRCTFEFSPPRRWIGRIHWEDKDATFTAEVPSGFVTGLPTRRFAQMVVEEMAVLDRRKFEDRREVFVKRIERRQHEQATGGSVQDLRHVVHLVWTE